MFKSVPKLSWLFIVVCGVSLAGGSPARADEPNSRKAAADLLALMNMESLLRQGIEDGLHAQLQGTPMAATLGPKIKGFLAKHLSWKALEPEFVALYAKHFSEAELQQMIVFYSTPVGKKAISLMPMLQMQGTQLAMAKVQAHMNELMQLLQAPAPSR
jgi:uncharacterized protein